MAEKDDAGQFDQDHVIKFTSDDKLKAHNKTATKSKNKATMLDMRVVQRFQERLNNAIKHGAVMLFNQHMKDICTDMNPDVPFDECIEDRINYLYSKSAPVVLYIPSKYTGYGIIVASCSINPEDIEHPKILSTFGGSIPDTNELPSMLDSVDVYLHWAPDNNDIDAPWQLDGLCIVPKDVPPTSEQAFYWHTYAAWPSSMKPPLHPNPTFWIDDWMS